MNLIEEKLGLWCLDQMMISGDTATNLQSSVIQSGLSLS